MNDKSTFYLALTIILIFLFQSIERITVEFIKSSNLPEQMEAQSAPSMPFPMFRIPIPELRQENAPAPGLPLAFQKFSRD